MVYPTYPNLEAEMRRSGYKADDLAKAMQIGVNSVYRILQGKQNLPIVKARMIRDELFPKMKLDYLFDCQIQTSA